jgi:O-antigen/teichoic acid export membrane protein
MTVLSAGANYAFRLVVLGALTGKEEAGIFALTIAWLAIGASLGDFGLSATLQPKLALARGADTLAFRAGIVLRLVTISLTWIGLNVYLLAAGENDLLLYVNLGFVGVFFSARLTGMRQIFEQLWRLKGRAYVSAGFTVLDSLIGLAIVAVIAATGRLTVGDVILAWTVSGLPGFILLVVPLLPVLRAAERLRRRVPLRYYRRLFLATMPVGLMTVAGQLSGQLETFVLDWAGSLRDVGAYNVAVSPLVGLVFVPVALSVGLAPLVTQVFRGMRRDLTIDHLTSLGVRTILVLALGVAAVTNVFADEIMRMFKDEYASDAYILRIQTAITGLVFLVVLLDQFMLAAGYRRQVLIGALLNLGGAILLEIPLVTHYGIRGMMAAKITAIVLTLAYQISVLRRDMRSGALAGVARAIGPLGVLGATLWLSWEWSLWLQAIVVIGGAGASVFLLGTLRFRELLELRGLRLS